MLRISIVQKDDTYSTGVKRTNYMCIDLEQVIELLKSNDFDKVIIEKKEDKKKSKK